MERMLRGIVRHSLRAIGLELRSYHCDASVRRARNQLLSTLDVDLVLDVGANVGQFAEELLDDGYRGRLVSFEPLTAAHAKLTQRCEVRRAPNWLVHDRLAIGAERGSQELFVAGNSVSSSFLKMLPRHIKAAPHSAYIGKETVRVARLDDIGPQYIERAKSTFIKVDTQGAEWQVLDGASNVLRQAVALQLELSLVSLYEGQHLWTDFLARLEPLGYSLYFAYPAFTDDRTGQTLQLDACFVRKELFA